MPPKFIYSALMSPLSFQSCYSTAFLAPLLGYLIDPSFTTQNIHKIERSFNFKIFWKEKYKKAIKISLAYIIFPMLLMSIKSKK